MRKALFEVAAAVAAAAIGFLVLKISDGLNPIAQWVLVIGIAVVAFAAASWAGRNIGRPSSSPRRFRVGTHIRSGDSVTISDIGVEPSSNADVAVGDDVSSKKQTRIQGVRIGRDHGKK